MYRQEIVFLSLFLLETFSKPDLLHGGVLYYCKRCKAYLAASEFYPCSIEHHTRLCHPCNAAVTTENRRKNGNRHRRMLRSLRQRYRALESIAEITEEDVRLIERFWDDSGALPEVSFRRTAEESSSRNPAKRGCPKSWKPSTEFVDGTPMRASE